MTTFSHTCISRLRANRLTLRLLLAAVLLLPVAGREKSLAAEASPCEALDRVKWGPNPLGEDYFALLLDFPPNPLPEVSVLSCWACGLWKQPSSPHHDLPGRITEALLFQRAQCFRALGMRKEALEDCRTILRSYPHSPLAQDAIQTIVQVLFEQKNYAAVAALFDSLGPDHREGLKPTSLYLIAQSHYILGRDDPAEHLLKQIPPHAEVYPYALYTLAQVFYRKGDPDRALLIIRVVHDAPAGFDVPEILREMARLTQARMLYQQGSYEKAIEGFRALRASSYFLPEALMGMGWCYQALGDFPRAVAYFQAVEASYADGDTLVRAHLERAGILARAKSYPNAFQVYREALNNLHFRVSQYKKYGADPEWLRWLADQFLDRSRDVVMVPAQAPMMNQEADLPEEMEPLLERERHLSPRLKRLLGIREALEHVGLLLDRATFPEAPGQTEGSALAAAYPPLEVTAPSLEPSLSALLDLVFALLDTEYRLIFTGSVLGLLTQEEKEVFARDGLLFYRRELETSLLPPGAADDARAALSRLQSTVRHLPLSLEERERVLAKLVYAMRNLEASLAVLDQWAEGAEALSPSESQPTRYLLLAQWMTLVRVYLSLRSWDVQSPAVFLLDHPSLESQRTSPLAPPEDTLRRLKQRINTVWQRLTLLSEREIANLHAERLEVLEALVARTQFEYADALVQEQERILDSLKETSADADAGEESERAVFDPAGDSAEETR